MFIAASGLARAILSVFLDLQEINFTNILHTT